MTNELEQLQMIEQNMQHTMVQKQSVQGEIIEIDGALEELEKTEESYYTLGNIMVKKSPKQLTEQLKEQKRLLEVRMQTISKQEERLNAKKKDLQSQVMKSMEGKDDD